jgi:two-component system NtrC family sensor kinase
MFTRTTSIRGKIAAGFLLSFGFLLLVAGFMFVNLLAVEDGVGSHAGISRFLDTTLEMRRYEKNYLLYGKREDLERALEYAGSASALVAEGAMGGAGALHRARWLRFLAGMERDAGLPDCVDRTVRSLREYRALLQAADERRAKEGGAESLATAAAIRDLGRGITDIAERLSAAESRNIQEVLRSGRRTLILLVMLFLAGNALIARVIVLTAIRPLEELERGMQRIASGDFQALPEGPGHGEISSMNAAFNRMMREVFQHRQEALESERLASLGTALAGIAHEINNPLSNVSTSAEILREENERADPRERRELIDQIISQTDRATDIIRTVLDFTREPRTDRRSANLLATVRAALILVHARTPPLVSIDVDVAPGLEIRMDKTKLEQAFVNLFTNAFDALADGGRGGKVRVSAQPSGEKDVEIVFEDTGRGMAREVLERVFDPFFTTKDVGHGTGLGLYLTHQIVEQHGGTIRLESTAGEGTTVHLTLPRGEPHAAEPAQDARPQEPTGRS